MTVKRFDISGEHYEVFGDNNGEYCLYEDYAELQRQLTAYEATVTNLTAQVQGLAAENAKLKQSNPKLQTMMLALDAFFADEDVPERAMLETYNILRNAVETPATDAALAEIRNEARAEGVDMLVEYCKEKALEKSYDFFMDAAAVSEGFSRKLRKEQRK